MRKSHVITWFEREFIQPTPPQAKAWPLIEGGRNVLIVSPTGTGKTFAAFLSVLNELALLHEDGKLRQTIYAIYISPLRALSYDLEKNLNNPFRGIMAAIRRSATKGGNPWHGFVFFHGSSCPEGAFVATALTSNPAAEHWRSWMFQAACDR